MLDIDAKYLATREDRVSRYVATNYTQLCTYGTEGFDLAHEARHVGSEIEQRAVVAACVDEHAVADDALNAATREAEVAHELATKIR